MCLPCKPVHGPSLNMRIPRARLCALTACLIAYHTEGHIMLADSCVLNGHIFISPHSCVHMSDPHSHMLCGSAFVLQVHAHTWSMLDVPQASTLMPGYLLRNTQPQQRRRALHRHPSPDPGVTRSPMHAWPNTSLFMLPPLLPMPSALWKTNDPGVASCFSCQWRPTHLAPARDSADGPPGSAPPSTPADLLYLSPLLLLALLLLLLLLLILRDRTSD